eukprot:g10657.t1
MASIKALHTDWFPVRYGSDFYDQIATGGIFSVCARRRDVGVNVLDENPDSASRKPESPPCSCEGGEEVVGLLCLRHELGDRTDVPVEITGSPRFLYIATLGVARHARGCGIAKALVRHRLYEGLGFAYYSTRCGFYELNGKSYDAYTYVYMFDKHLQNRLQKTNCAAAAGD